MNKVSVITTLYNYGNFINDCITSVMSQSYSGVEMVVVDDGSEDDGFNIVKKLCNKYKNLKLIGLNRNYGYSVAKNVGIKECSGDFIAMLDADDMLLPGSISKRLNAIISGYDMVHGYALNFSSSKRWENELRKKWKINYDKNLRWRFVHPQSVMLRKSVHEIVGMYDECLKCKSDREMWARVFNHGLKVKFIDEAVCLYRIHDRQMHKSKWKKDNNKRLSSELMSLIEIRKKDLSECIKLSNYKINEKINMKEHFSEEEAMSIAKSDPSKLYGDEFFSKRQKKHSWNYSIGKYAGMKLGMRSAIDLGCGIGSFLSGVKSNGIEVMGIEVGYDSAKPYLIDDVSEKIFYGDLSKDCIFPQHDCSISIEVAEHIPESFADVFVKNLCSSSSRLILLTAARPGQPGHNHFNCQNPSYWIKKIKRHGFSYREDLTKKISEGWMANCKGVPSYICKNVMVFKISKNNNTKQHFESAQSISINEIDKKFSISFDLPDRDTSGKHKFFQRMREELSYRGFAIKGGNKKSDVHFFINSKNHLSKINMKRLDGVYFTGSNQHEKTNSSILNSMKIADGIIYQSNYCKKMACKILNFKDEKKPSSVIFNGCNPSEFDIDPVVLDKPYLLAMCKWRRHKRLAESISGFEKSNIDAKMVVAGPADAHSNNPNIIFIGDVCRSTLARYVAGCFATIHLAWIDWCPNSVVESLVAGKQVVHTNSGGTSEIVNGRGYIIEDEIWNGEKANPKEPPYLNPDKVASAIYKSFINPIKNFDISDLLISKTVDSYVNFAKYLLETKR
jgi:glycosyltransferase involved in cell wall biosynthesis